MRDKKTLLITTDNHTIGIQTVANIILKKVNIEPEMFYLSFNLPEYPESVEDNILNQVINEIDDADGKVLIGFHLKELSLERSLQLVTKIKKFRGNKVQLVAGGTYATAEPSSLLGIFDYVVIGSGEGIHWVFDAVFENKAVDPIVVAPPTGFEYPLFADCWVLNEDGEITKRRLRPLVHPQYRNSQALEIMLGFGCSYSCSYCEVSSLRKIFRGRYRISFANEEQAIDLVKKESRLNPEVQYIYFFDEDFLLKPSGWIERFSALYKENIGLPFFIFATPSSVLKFQNKLLKLSQSGLDTVNMGIQSGSEHISKGLFGRKESKEEIIKCMQTLVNLYLGSGTTSPPMLDFIILNPYEGSNDLLETIDLIQNLPTPFNAIMHCISFFRGTPFYEKAKHESVIHKDYTFKYDLHDFISRVSKNELRIDFSKEESLQWLFLNVLIYGMNGLHKEIEGKRYLGNLSKERLNELIVLVSEFSYHDIISLAKSFPDPMSEAEIPWERKLNINFHPSNVYQSAFQTNNRWYK